ncbi:MAG: hypothetical protein NUV46_02280 [Nanoarchaeota archaeon]|nr:hypothetical protein [Nanoarchaeota archaeon]
MKKINSKGAMEMSVGTIVTIVLLMSVLVLGLFFVQRIFQSGENALESIDSQVQNEINQLFSDDSKRVVIFPTSREVVIKKGGSTSKGFAFSVYNNDNSQASFTYTIKAGEIGNSCGESMTLQKADSYLEIGSEGSFSLGPSSSLESARIVKFIIPESAPSCIISYELEVMRNTQVYDSVQVPLEIIG